ncbi:MAG: hypothetical protein JWO20_1848, partial [Candidatus Angelobacter sp.]|nr:hypothetical protein [Candidatus Angelobacter sp.]
MCGECSGCWKPGALIKENSANLCQMGILFVLIFWAGFGAVVAIVGGIVAGRLASRLTRGTGESRKRLVGQAALFPLYCVLWAALVFIFQATINAVYFHRDIGIGDSSRCTFPNGYAL